MWKHLEPRSASLEEVFAPLHIRTAQFDRAWSIAELRLTQIDVSWLQSWFSRLTPESAENWIKSAMLAKLTEDAFATYRQMFGSILLCAGAEVCREDSNEDSVWPSIRKLLPDSHSLHRELFLSNGQPSQLTKDLISEAVRSLNLRHAMDIEGTQQWFVTIKLQFGFTFRGAKNRLAEWLVNLGRPHAIQYLNGKSDYCELRSDSFQSLWKTLTQYRRGLIGEDEVRALLLESPWIKEHWITDLLAEAKSRIETLGTGEHQADVEESAEVDAAEEDFCPIADIALDWPHGDAPRLKFYLDRQAIVNEVQGSDSTELDFYIEGSRLLRWLRQSNGSWAGDDAIYAESERDRARPRLNPIMLTICTSSNETIAEWDLANSGLANDVLLFDLDSKRLIRAGQERLEQNRNYALLCRREFMIDGCAIAEVFDRSGMQRKAVRLPCPLDEDISISFEDFRLWQPVKAHTIHQRSPSLLLRTALCAVSLNGRSHLVLEGLPADTEVVRMLIHKKTYDMQDEGTLWRTPKEIVITAELAARQRRIYVQYRSNGLHYTKEPRLEFSLLGAAILQHDYTNDLEKTCFKVLADGEEINRSQGTGYLRIWTPRHDVRATVFEGGCLVGRLRNSRCKLNDIPGHGGKLCVLSEGEKCDFEVRCLDKGCIKHFIPAMMNNQAQLFFSQEKDPRDVGEQGYAIWEWVCGSNRKARLQRLKPDAILEGSKKRRWKLACADSPMALAITWKGAWLGSWWDLDRIKSYVERRGELSGHDYAVVKWLRVPVLHSALSYAFGKAVLQSPCQFMKAWLRECQVPDGVMSHGHIGGLDAVVRHFLWNDFPLAHASDAASIISESGNNAVDEADCPGHLANLTEISPILLWKGLEHIQKRYPLKIKNIVELFVRHQLGLPYGSDKQKVRFRLQGLEKRALSATGINEERLIELAVARFRSLHSGSSHLSEADSADLLHFGQTVSGRRYLATRLGLYWLDQGII